MKNKLITVFLIIISILTLQVAAITAFADSGPLNVNKAEVLKELGLFSGTDKGFELDKKPTRAESSVMLVRLLGKEAAAKASNTNVSFTDVPGWSCPYIGYLFNNKLAYGLSSTQFGSNNIITADQYLTMVLRALGYSDINADFSSGNAADKAKEIGLISDTQAAKFKSASDFIRGDIVDISYNALQTKLKNSNKTLIEKLIFDEKVVQEDTADKYSLNNNKYTATGVISNNVPDASGFNLTINTAGTENIYHINGQMLSSLIKGVFVDFDVSGGKIIKFNEISNYSYNYGVNGDYNCYLFRVTGVDTVNKTLKVMKFSSEVNYQYGDEYSFNFDSGLNVYDATNKDLVVGGKSISSIMAGDYVWLDQNSTRTGAAIKNIVKINISNMVKPKIAYLETKGVVTDTGIDMNGPTAKVNLQGYVKTFNVANSVASAPDITKGNYIEFTLNCANAISVVDSTKTSTYASSSVNIFVIDNVNTSDKLIKCYRLKTDGTNREDTTNTLYFTYDPDTLSVYDVTDKDAVKGGLAASDIRQGSYVWMDKSANNTGSQVTKILKINVDDILN